MKTIVIDLEKCIGCFNCQLACKDEHVENDWSPIARPQPEGHFWMNVYQRERGTVPKVKVDWMPVLCMHCEAAPCIPSCTEKAIYKRDDGIVIIDPVKCNGCKDCMEACPYDVIYFNDELEICQKCTLCTHLLDRGWKEPRCVTACPAGAMVFGEIEELDGLLARAEAWKPEAGAEPVIKYIGLPRPFIAGEIYSPQEDRCVEAVKVSLTDLSTGETITTHTDNYGDFWLKELKESTYALTIEKEGYYSKQIKPISTKEDINIGSIKLYRRR